MRDEDYAKLLEDTQHELLAGTRPVGVLGLTPVTLRLLASLAPSGLDRAVEAVYAPRAANDWPKLTVPVRPFDALREATCGVLVVAAGTEKEDLLCTALPYISSTPKMIVAGYGHLGFRDAVFHQEQAQLLVPSLANGYPNSVQGRYHHLPVEGDRTARRELASHRVRHLRRVPAPPLPSRHVRPPGLRLRRPARRPELS
jgi:O-methyltransferase